MNPTDLGMVVRRLVEDPSVLGLGNLDLKRASSLPGQVGLLLEDPIGSILYVVELQLAATDDRHVIRVVERWAEERKLHQARRCFAVLVAEEIAPRYQNILQLISRAVPMVPLKMRISQSEGTTTLRFESVALLLR